MIAGSILHRLEHIQFSGVLPPPRIPAVLRERVQHVPSRRPVARPRSDRTADMPPDPFISWLLARAGLEPAAYRSVPMQRRVPACLRQLRVTSGADARKLLENQPELLPGAVNSVLIGMTGFFRDRLVFEHLRRVSLPELVAARRALRVYSAGVSDGRELCSMALLLAEAGVLEQSVLMGVDIRREAIREAMTGAFDFEVLEHLEPGWLGRYFQVRHGKYFLRPEIRSRLRWEVGDLLSFRQDEAWDIVLFRNVAIYLNEPHASDVWARLANQISSGGLLITGKAERPPAGLPLIRVAPSIYRKLEVHR